MKNGKSFDIAETLFGNATTSMNWFQESANALSHTYTRQLEVANTFFKNAFETSMGVNKDGIALATERVEKFRTLIQENLKTWENISSKNFATFTETFKKATPSFSANEQLASLVNVFTEQTESLKAFNEKYLQTVTKQFSAANNTLSPVFVTLQKDLETNYEKSKVSLKEFSDTYSKQLTETASTSKEMLHDLNERISSMISDNTKLWSEILAASEKKTAETSHNAPAKAAVTEPKSSVSAVEITKKSKN